MPTEEKHSINDDYMHITAEVNPTTCIGSPVIEKGGGGGSWVCGLPSLTCFINVFFLLDILSKCRLSFVADFLTMRNTI